MLGLFLFVCVEEWVKASCVRARVRRSSVTVLPWLPMKGTASALSPPMRRLGRGRQQRVLAESETTRNFLFWYLTLFLFWFCRHDLTQESHRFAFRVEVFTPSPVLARQWKHYGQSSEKVPSERSTQWTPGRGSAPEEGGCGSFASASPASPLRPLWSATRCQRK